MSHAERLVRQFAATHPAEAARVLDSQAPVGVAAILSRLPEEAAAAVLGQIAPASAALALEVVDPERGGLLLARLPAEVAAALLRRVPAASRERLLAHLPGADRLRPLLVLPEDTAGALMDPKVLALPEDLDLDEVRRRLGRHAPHVALELYVVDREQRLVGVADLREVLDPSRRGPLAAVVRAVEPLPARADLTAMSAHPGWTERGSLPVVDRSGTFLGAVRAERLRQRTHGVSPQRSRVERDAVVALGELFWLGLSGAFTGLARPQTPEDEP